MALERTAKKLQVDLVHLKLEKGELKPPYGLGSLLRRHWVNPRTNEVVSIEDAVLGHYELDGWRGCSHEGGLLLNLIKSMSFPEVSMRNRATYIEALYAQNMAFARFATSELLDNVKNATKVQIKKNYQIMASSEPYTWGGTGKGPSEWVWQETSTTSMLDFFPGLEEWMFLELFENFGKENILRIAELFAENPYEYRKGWPDLTIWKDNRVLFLEVKGPGDSLQKSQKTIIEKFIKPLELQFSLVDVQVS